MAGLFGGAPKPRVQGPVPMPDTSSPLIRASENEQLRRIAGRSGRSSTNLSGGSGGVNAYANSTYGQN